MENNTIGDEKHSSEDDEKLHGAFDDEPELYTTRTPGDYHTELLVKTVIETEFNGKCDLPADGTMFSDCKKAFLPPSNYETLSDLRLSSRKVLSNLPPDGSKSTLTTWVRRLRELSNWHRKRRG